MHKILICLSTAGLLISPAIAGIDAATHPDDVASINAAVTGYLNDYSGDLTPLIDQSALPSPRACVAHDAATFGVLIGPQDTVFRRRLNGPGNDITLLSAALKARADGPVTLFPLSGGDASRAALGKAMTDVLAAATCGDRVFVHFSGYSVSGEMLLQVEQRIVSSKLTDDKIEDLTSAVEDGTDDGGDLPAVIDALGAVTEADNLDPGLLEQLQAITQVPLLLNLNRNPDGRMELFSSFDLNTFVTLARNRGADVVVSLDSPFADGAAIGRSQEIAGDSDLWGAQSDGGDEGPDLRLTPQHGDFLALYSTVGNQAAFDQEFDNADGSKTVYGAFTFQYARALQTVDIASARELGDSVTNIPDEGRPDEAVYRVEGSNPNMALFAGGAQLEASADAIRILSPEPTRGPSTVPSSSLDVTGLVSWPTPISAVLVNGQPATLDGTGHFAEKVSLTTGANTIRVLALTQDNRILQKSIDVVFGGDAQALKGSGKRYALIIGNADYGADTGFAHLSTPIADADALESVLTQHYGFVTEATLPNGSIARLSLRNGSLVDIQTALYDVSLIAGDNDTVLIYYAGHGIYEPVTTTAFWVPVDAKAGAPFTYLSASAISEAIARIQARKVILVSDSCFSGALMRSGPPDGEKIDADKRVDALLALQKRKSRILVSSGNNEPVADAGGNGHSIFAQALLNGLSNEDHDQFSARELFDDYILTAVTANSKQEPQFRPLDNVGHDGGDVIFVRTEN